MDATTLAPTDEQRHILNLILTTKDNLLINALAGTGKSSTLLLIDRVIKGPILYLVFNTDNAMKIMSLEQMAKERRSVKSGHSKDPISRVKSTSTVRTLNSLGHRIWAGTCSGNLTVDPKKTQQLLRQEIDRLPKSAKGEAYDIFWDIISGVALAKSLGYIPIGKFPNTKRLISPEDFFLSQEEIPSELFIDLLDAVLVSSIKAAYAGNIDYNDQVYMPALFGGTYPRFPLVLVDEAQDLSPVNHEMLNHLKGSRIVAVGDPWQSIYGFRGAVREGMTHLRENFNMVEADLSVSFRCPSSIVKNVWWRVPKMKWIKEGGRVANLHNPSAFSFADNCAIICRNNAPLFALALRLLSSGRSVTVSGSDIGPRIIGIMRKLGDDQTPQQELLNVIEDWRAAKLSRESTTADDIANCMRVFAEFGETLSQAIGYAEHIFEQRGTIHLLTGHKAKGLEWPTVYHLDPWLLRDDEQDLNLKYVISTRAMDTYYEINSKEIKW